MKYFIAICTCIILLCSYGRADKDKMIRENQTEVMTSISSLSDETQTYHRLTTEKRYDAPNLKVSEESGLFLSLRIPVLPKTHKYLATIKILCNYRILLPEEKSKSLYPCINYVKSSCRYFIYTLEHILI